MTEADQSYDSRIQKLEEELSFLDDHVVKQDKEILNLRTKLEKAVLGLKELRNHFDSGALQTGLGDEKPPHY
ncbi:MAG: SlyX family protein [Verrucomicrobia bacterium]|nr:SlyX family protein [Verrucomicrobiota bacterium]